MNSTAGRLNHGQDGCWVAPIRDITVTIAIYRPETWTRALQYYIHQSIGKSRCFIPSSDTIHNSDFDDVMFPNPLYPPRPLAPPINGAPEEICQDSDELFIHRENGGPKWAGDKNRPHLDGFFFLRSRSGCSPASWTIDTRPFVYPRSAYSVNPVSSVALPGFIFEFTNVRQ